MTHQKMLLEVIEEARPGLDAHIRANKVPVLTGADEADVNCGGCGIALAAKASPADLRKSFQTDQRLILECICGALNVVPRD